MTYLEIFDIVYNIVKFIIIVLGGLSFAFFILMTCLYIPSFFQKIVNLKKAEDILAHNIEIVEKATFFETSTEFNKIIEEQMDKIRSNAAKIKSQDAQIEAQKKEIVKNAPKK
ncbi:Uncharacterised protein [Acholeplasma oculi]|uniref:Uncharacterized protein n=1 Tax=Acholeplasma oculi TaxID=35623 RepID=A0A061A8P2_9MOLU|nr:hypothetical protein [Acholeplasma oculi]CDR30203.1 hypothetical protein Aocu_01300 [Acholeplasma oculi]SKC44003.1 hypothetical protein SAMN02745122_1042 [Acholeplasma oculi]SUT88572.1 Uncharacterised protein [Acholeplasma oculi]